MWQPRFLYAWVTALTPAKSLPYPQKCANPPRLPIASCRAGACPRRAFYENAIACQAIHICYEPPSVVVMLCITGGGKPPPYRGLFKKPVIARK